MPKQQSPDPKWPLQFLTLDNLRLSPQGQLALTSLSKLQRKALYDLCSILALTFYDKEMRAAAEALRDLIREETLDRNHNLCGFDKTEEEKKLEQNPIHHYKKDA